MIKDVQTLIDQYSNWLKDNTKLRQVENWIEITTPYLDRNNDHLQIYAKRNNGNYILTDDGYTIEDLKLQGCKLESRKRQDLLKMTLNGFGIRLDEGALVTHASVNNFAMRKHNLIQAMLAVNDLFYLAVPMIASLFLEDVTDWLDLNEIRYTPNVKFTGKTGYDHVFDFVIPKSRIQPERIIKTINKPTKNTAEAAAFAWIDTREVRSPDSRAYAFLNDAEHDVAISILDALKNYDIRPISWSRRDDIRQELIA